MLFRLIGLLHYLSCIHCTFLTLHYGLYIYQLICLTLYYCSIPYAVSFTLVISLAHSPFLSYLLYGLLCTFYLTTSNFFQFHLLINHVVSTCWLSLISFLRYFAALLSCLFLRALYIFHSHIVPISSVHQFSHSSIWPLPWCVDSTVRPGRTQFSVAHPVTGATSFLCHLRSQLPMNSSPPSMQVGAVRVSLSVHTILPFNMEPPGTDRGCIVFYTATGVWGEGVWGEGGHLHLCEPPTRIHADGDTNSRKPIKAKRGWKTCLRPTVLSTAYGVGLAAVVVSEHGCGRRNDLFRRLGWLSGVRGVLGIETICFDGFRKYLYSQNMSCAVANQKWPEVSSFRHPPWRTCQVSLTKGLLYSFRTLPHPSRSFKT